MMEQLFSSLDAQEQKEIQLIGLFRQAGYQKCRLGKFDEYELFDQNRAFLVGDRMLTFTDPYGKLYALRPDVTLSVMKQAVYQPDNEYKVYYKEDVFRLSPETHQYESRCQIGVEAIEKLAVGTQKSFKMLQLAQRALKCLGGKSVLVLSHMGFLAENHWYSVQSQIAMDQILLYIGQKNRHDLLKYLEQLECPPRDAKILTSAISLTGQYEGVLEKIREENLGKEIEDAAIELTEYAKKLAANENQKVILDFSMVNPLSYYNGLVFQGYIEGCSHYVLSGGCYDKLAIKFLPKYKSTCRAIGFALDLDALEPHLKEEVVIC